jgi:tRNA A58 N-methylase Trm61
MPEELVRICLDAGCPPGGRVLDPFLGSGTSAVVAEDMDMGIEFYGIELSPENAQHATEGILTVRVKRLEKADGARTRSPKGGAIVETTVNSELIVGEELDRAYLDTALVMSKELLP